MTLWRPPQIPYLSDFVFGHWPDGDEDAMRRAAQHWTDMAEALKKLQQPAGQAMNEALSAIDGKAHNALSSYWQDIAGTDGSDLQTLINHCESFANQLEHGATDIEHTKLIIYISAMAMLASLVWTLIPGVGEVAEAGAIIAAKAAITKAVEELIGKIAAKGAIFLGERLAGIATKVAVGAVVGTAFGAGTDAAAQGIQLAEHHRDEGFDFGSLGMSAASGALAGGIAAPVSGALSSKLDNSVVSALAGDAKPGELAQYVTNNVAEIPSNALGNAAAQVATNPDHKLDPGSLLEGAGERPCQ